VSDEHEFADWLVADLEWFGPRAKMSREHLARAMAEALRLWTTDAATPVARVAAPPRQPSEQEQAEEVASLPASGRERLQKELDQAAAAPTSRIGTPSAKLTITKPAAKAKDSEPAAKPKSRKAPADAQRPAATSPGLPPPPAPSAPRVAVGLSGGDFIHFAIIILASFFPAWAGEQFPSEVLEDKTATFITVWFLTLPLSTGMTVIMVGLSRGWFKSDDWRTTVAKVAAIMIGTTIFGYAGVAATPGLPDPTELPSGPLLYKLAFGAIFILAGYAVLYGFPLYAASFLVAVYTAYVLDTKVLPHLGYGRGEF
jgi:hypothetical protein